MARLQLGYSRKEFATNYGIPSATLQAWETARYPITTKGLQRYINALSTAGLTCTQPWILYGTPPAPNLILEKNYYSLSDHYLSFSQHPEKQLQNHNKLLQEINFFESLYKDAIVLLINNDNMLPLYHIGDYVGGHKLKVLPHNHKNQQAYIIKLTTGATLVRFIRHGLQKNTYDLFVSNTDSSIEKPFLYNQSIKFFAPIIWHRRYLFT